MPFVAFTPNLRRHVEVDRCEVEADTLREALEAVFEQQPRLRSYLLDDRGAVRKHIAIVINGDAIADRETLSDLLTARDEVFIMQALSGG